MAPEFGLERGRGCGGRGDVCLAPTASTGCGDYDGRMPGTKWSPEHHRQRARRRRVSVNKGVMAMACESTNGEGEKGQELTADP